MNEYISIFEDNGHKIVIKRNELYIVTRNLYVNNLRYGALNTCLRNESIFLQNQNKILSSKLKEKRKQIHLLKRKREDNIDEKCNKKRKLN